MGPTSHKVPIALPSPETTEGWTTSYLASVKGLAEAASTSQSPCSSPGMSGSAQLIVQCLILHHLFSHLSSHARKSHPRAHDGGEATFDSLNCGPVCQILFATETFKSAAPNKPGLHLGVRLPNLGFSPPPPHSPACITLHVTVHCPSNYVVRVIRCHT